MVAARLLGIDDAVAVLPAGYETQLTDNVTDPIPPGLKQRIATARVLANKPRIILDFNAGYQISEHGKIALVVNNLLNTTYSLRPLKAEPMRSVLVQYQLNY